MNRKKVTQHYSEVSNQILIQDYVWCLANTWRQAIAIYSSLALVFDGTKRMVDIHYIKEKLAHAEDSEEVFIIESEIESRIKSHVLSKEYLDEKTKEEKDKWGVFNWGVSK